MFLLQNPGVSTLPHPSCHWHFLGFAFCPACWGRGTLSRWGILGHSQGQRKEHGMAEAGQGESGGAPNPGQPPRSPIEMALPRRLGAAVATQPPPACYGCLTLPSQYPDGSPSPEISSQRVVPAVSHWPGVVPGDCPWKGPGSGGDSLAQPLQPLHCSCALGSCPLGVGSTTPLHRVP